MKDFAGSHQNSSAIRRFMAKTMWIISISRNSIVVIIGMILAYILESKGWELFKITGMESTAFQIQYFGLYCHARCLHNGVNVITVLLFNFDSEEEFCSDDCDTDCTLDLRDYTSKKFPKREESRSGYSTDMVVKW
jgi:hypothetical protein